MPRKRQSVVIIDELSQGAGVGFLADMPLRRPVKARWRDAGAGFRHALKAKIEAIGEYSGKEPLFFCRRCAVTQIDKFLTESRPPINLQQQVGDFDAREGIAY